MPADPDTATTAAPFEGHWPRRCAEHRTVGPHRAWCHDCNEWCYPDDPCHECGPTHEQIVAEAREAERKRWAAQFREMAAAVLPHIGPSGNMTVAQLQALSPRAAGQPEGRLLLDLADMLDRAS